MDNSNALKTQTILQGNTYQYRIVRVIGSGSFGITYLAEMFDAEGNPTGMYAAVKELFMADFTARHASKVVVVSHPEVFGNYFRRFRSEAESLANIHHRNVVNVFEYFLANDTIYYSMSFIDGGTLDEKILKEGSLREDEALGITRTLAEALDLIHSKGMLHLDIKPGNVMMLNGDIPVLIDFGLAKHFGADGPPSGAAGTGMGTPGYAPIEQGNFTSADTGRVPYTLDVYALGASLFKMLTGRRPPQASEIFQEGFPDDELKEKNVSAAVIALLHWSMAPEYHARYQNVRQMISDIDDILGCKAGEGTPILLQTSMIPSARFPELENPYPPVDGPVMAEVAGFIPAAEGPQIATAEPYVGQVAYPGPPMSAPHNVVSGAPVSSADTYQQVLPKRKSGKGLIAIAASVAVLLGLGCVGYTAGLFDTTKSVHRSIDEEEDYDNDIVIERTNAPEADRAKEYTAPAMTSGNRKSKKEKTAAVSADTVEYGRSWSDKVKKVTSNYNPDK